MLSGKRLRQYLAYKVHDVKSPIEKKPPVKAKRAGTRRGPARDPKYRAFVRTLACCVCGTSRGVEAAHTGEDGGMRMKASDYSCIPLCPACHRTGTYAYHRLGREGFERRWRGRCAEIAAALVTEWLILRKRTA